MKKIEKEKFELMYELEEIEEVGEVGYKNAVDITVSNNHTFLLSNGIVSHNSAKSGLSSILGRKALGYYAMFGVPPNAYDMGMDAIIKSDKLKALQKIVGFEYGKLEQKNINFKNIILATDADLPGFFIRGQLIGLIYRFGQNLFNEGRVKILKTPLFVCTDKKENIIDWFYSFEDQAIFEKENSGKGYNYEYKKGLSGWDKEELQTVIDKDGFDNMLEVLSLGDHEEDLLETKELIDSWLSGKKADVRKEMLDGFGFSIFNM